MSKTEIKFTFFSSYIFRIPSFPFNFYQNLTSGTRITDEQIKELAKNNHIKESLFIASPELYSEIQKWISFEDYSPDKADKIKISLLKYFIRMSTRCTPFGLFSACGSGKFDDKTQININGSSSFYRKTRFDMQFVGNLANTLQAFQVLQDKLFFYPNTTLYKLGDFYRYIQYTLNKSNRKYSLEAVKRTEYLDLILEKSRFGISKTDLVNFLISDEITEKEAVIFIEELINHQILISELEMTLTGDDYFNKLIDLNELIKDTYKSNLDEKEKTNILVKNSETNDSLLDLKALSKKLLDNDSFQDETFSNYGKIIQILKDNNLSFNEKHLFQTDLFINSKAFTLDYNYKKELLNTIKFLNKISPATPQKNLKNFKKEFLKRYDHEAIPLVEALDFETGIGYGSNNKNFDITPILDELGLKNKQKTENQIIFNEVENIIYSKLKNAIINKEKNSELNYQDFNNIDFSHQNLSSTFSCLFEIVKENEKEWISIQSIGGSSAANLFSRFCYGNSEINDLANEITNYESDSLEGKIVAEIVHLPEARTGNVLKRPAFRTHEIPYLGKSNLDTSKQIPIGDIILKMGSNRIILWSKENQKEIIPKLSNAHNFSYQALPIYQFLCDMQFENKKTSLGINTTNLEKLFEYFPRITIGNCIIVKAKWIFRQEQNPDFFKNLKSNSKIYDQDISRLLSDINDCISYAMPQYVSLIDDDNTLLVNTQNYDCLKMLLSAIKNRTKFTLEEYLFPSEKTIKDKTDYYANQFVAGVKWKRN